jgi:hypothetical protein
MHMVIAIAALAVLIYQVLIPLWGYYSLPPTTRAVLSILGRPVRIRSGGTMTLAALLKGARAATAPPTTTGIPIYVDPSGLSEAGAGDESTVVVVSDPMPLKDHLEGSLKPLGLGCFVRDGVLMITSEKEVDRALRDYPTRARRP